MTMASATVIQQPDGAVSSTPVISPLCKLDLPKPLTYKTRRIITNETDELIRKRNALDRALLAEARRRQGDLKPSHWLLRNKILKLSDALAKQEAEHIHTRNNSIRERELLYTWDPSPERKIDLELLKAVQCKFKSNLDTYLVDREALLQSNELGSNIGTDGDKDSQDETLSKPEAESGSSSDTADFDKDSFGDAWTESIPSLDGSFDDYARQKSKQRKLVDERNDLTAKEERRNQVEKEQTANKQQTSNLESEALHPSLCSSQLEEEEAENTGNTAAIDSMCQSRKKLQVYGKKVHIKAEGHDVSETTPKPTGASSDDISIAKNKASETKTTSKPSPKVKTSGVQNESLIEPWYKRHARAVMSASFNDMVYDRPNRKRKRPCSDVYVHGALSEPHAIVSDDWSLPTPPTSSSAPSPSSSTPTETKMIDKYQGEVNTSKDKARPGKARKQYGLSVPELSLPEPLACTTSSFVSTQEGPWSAQGEPSNTMSAF